MMISEKIYFAIQKAAVLHNGQYRKDKTTPFIAHPFSVGLLLSKYTNDEDIVISGFLHDVLEDVDSYTRDDMKNDFGSRVTSMVEGVTHDNNLEWKERTSKYLEKLKGNKECIMISCADKVHNIQSSIDGFEMMGDAFWDSFIAKPKDYYWFYCSVLDITKDYLDNPIVNELDSVINTAKKTVFASLE